MAKSKYEQIKSRLCEVTKWAEAGLTNEQIAKNLKISRDTLFNYEKSYTDVSDALKRGRAHANEEVENALFKKATGYSVFIEKNYKVKQVKEVNGRVYTEEELVKGEEEVYIPADTAAQIFWLKNRCPDRWKDKHDIASDGVQISVNMSTEAEDFSR